ncbi:C9orf64 [Blepharisma stoltei]|uniref:Queuosine 5'-phosphate N-glycosylase/hydrolase n=1 Tax=Blepharisma stoltei TaxID=1481888 RepID=A0AAU9JK75_9CILI|nr:unnamed protein product [Blepharisma stoltei]
MSIVKNSAHSISRDLIHVSIDNDALDALIARIQANNSKPTPWNDWQSHYKGVNKVNYIFALDALNFCFWPKPGFEYDNLAGNLKALMERDPNILSPNSIAAMTDEFIQQEIFQDASFPLINERCRLLREIGEQTIKCYAGDFNNILNSCQNSSEKLVEIITAIFPGFRDSCVYRGRQAFFYKRAQILVADLYASGAYEFNDIEKITMFPDYRVPQLLNTYGVLKYSQKLQNKIDSKILIQVGSEMEVEIRAATVKACDIISSRLDRIPIEVDHLLWQMGELSLNTLKEHHRTLTIFY